MPHPALLGLLTGIFSVVPFASPLVFIGAGLWLLAQSAIVPAIILVAFGSIVVFVADHFVRPVLIGGSTRMPFVWVLLGILGGVETFGLLGLLLGPVGDAILQHDEQYGAADAQCAPVLCSVRAGGDRRG